MSAANWPQAVALKGATGDTGATGAFGPGVSSLEYVDSAAPPNARVLSPSSFIITGVRIGSLQIASTQIYPMAEAYYCQISLPGVETGVAYNITLDGDNNVKFKVQDTNILINGYDDTETISFTAGSILSMYGTATEVKVYIDQTYWTTIPQSISASGVQFGAYQFGASAIPLTFTDFSLIPTVSGAGGGGGGAIPAGGATGAILTKRTEADSDTYWNVPTYATDNWLFTNLVGPPPPVVFGRVSTTSAAIYIPWSYPTQVPIGALTLYVPVINTLSVNYQAEIGLTMPTLNTYTPLVNVSTSYVNYHNGTSYVTGLILSKLSGTSGITSVTFPGDSTPRNAYINYNTVLANISTSVTNTATVWYANTNPAVNQSTVNFPVFLTAGPPSAVRELRITGITTAFQESIIWTAPSLNDKDDVNTSLTISSYNIAYGTSGSLIRYGGGVVDPVKKTSIIGSISTYTTPATLFPDSVYTFGVHANNTAFQAGVSSFFSSSTSSLTAVASPISGTLSFPSRYYTNGTITNILTNTTKTGLVDTNTNWPISITAPIHTLANRGSANANIMSFSTLYTNNSVSTIGATLTFGGFNQAAPSQVSQSNITVASQSITDSYVPTERQGFYLQTATLLTLNSGIFVASPYDYLVTVNQLQAGSKTGSARLTFQYDTPITTAPSITGVGINFSNSGVYYNAVTGVNVIHGQPIFTVSTVVTNMGNYYCSLPLLKYSGGVGEFTPLNESALTTNIISGSNNGAFTGGAITVRNSNIQSASLSGTYNTTLSIAVHANNIFAETATPTTARISSMVDGPSHTLVYSTLPQSIPNLPNTLTSVTGYRVNSGEAAGDGVPPFTLGTSGYNNTALLTENQELQVSGGAFTTVGGKLNAYKDYRSLYYTNLLLNTANYSGIAATGYRYATYAWRLNTTTSTYKTSIFFTINGTSSQIGIGAGSIAYINTIATPIRLYYRIEDAANPSPNVAAGVTITTSWINGNGLGTSVNSGNYNLPTTYSGTLNYGLTNTQITTTTTTAQFEETIPAAIAVGSLTINLYCRIGLPMNIPFFFTTVTAKIS